tara:strand:+ start:662 stop:1015 length:354 start_codon:yes stop_codon:yes gene_type:complete
MASKKTKSTEHLFLLTFSISAASVSAILLLHPNSPFTLPDPSLIGALNGVVATPEGRKFITSRPAISIMMVIPIITNIIVFSVSHYRVNENCRTNTDQYPLFPLAEGIYIGGNKRCC